MNEKIYRPLVVILLGALVLIMGGSLFYDVYQNIQEDARLEEAATNIALRHSACGDALDLMSEIIDAYHTDAYENPRIDTIYQQQLIAAEYQMLMQQAQATVIVACSP